MREGFYEPHDDVSYEQAFSALIEGRNLEELFVEKEESIEDILGRKRKTEIYELENEGSTEYWERRRTIGGEHLEKLDTSTLQS